MGQNKFLNVQKVSFIEVILPFIDDLTVILREHGVLEAMIVGSFARGDAYSGSDIDICVLNKIYTYDPLMIRTRLENIFKRKVDLINIELIPNHISTSMFNEGVKVL